MLDRRQIHTVIDTLIREARIRSVSDIHITEGMHVWYRIHGCLTQARDVLKEYDIREVLLGMMNEKQRKQFEDGQDVDFAWQTTDGCRQRVNIFCEQKKIAATIRLLNQHIPTLEELKIPTTLYQLSEEPRGIILVTGPTGSGKSTTLAAVIEAMNQKYDRHIITIEDPVELNLEGINQMQVNQKAGMDYAVALRASLRQDPDIVMIGEIRDEMVAKQAITTALTGHLVLTTLHTKNALGVPARLIDLGVSPVMLSIALLGMTSQRLVRKICPKCKISYKPSENSLEALLLGKDFYLGMDLYKGEGCKYCNYTGFLGQIALQEILRPTEKMRYLISRDDVDVNLKREARLTDFKSLLDDGKMKVLQGITTAQEVWKTLNGVYQINEVPRNFTKSDSV